MACLQLLKSAPSNSQMKFRCLCSSFSSMATLNRRTRFPNSRFRISCKADERDKQSNGEEPPESLFMKELRRRGMTPTSLLEEKTRSTEGNEEIKFREEDGGWSYSRRNGVSNDGEVSLSGQREKSMALNSEGLEVKRFSISN
ncbi:F2J10.10 protein [Striga asiatica]|uniref:F2J10.10 protein n=1 Tax=Striga asiatica TaxID=4170 RepID=A0A5A7PVQ8_STRAF|nr:F2J10.10 protein [Striga asiatica]